MDTTSSFSLKKVSQSLLFVSEPPPQHFGNPPNASSNPHWSNCNWLKSRFHFSFAEYHNSKNMNFGPLRVLNDDLVQPERGFGTHPHRDAEIVTYIVSGELTHKDSMGTQETLSRGGIQFMTAGTGVLHSEHNLNSTTPLRFIQMWFTPRQRSLPPNYGSMQGNPLLLVNRFTQLVSDVNSPEKTPVKVNQDVNIFVGILEKGKNLDFRVEKGRQGYLVSLEGAVRVKLHAREEEEYLEMHDAAEIKGGDCAMSFEADEESQLMIIEMALTGDSRF